MRAGIAENLVESQRGSYISDYIFENSQVSEVPESVVTFVENTLSNNYISMANQYGMKLEDFLSYMGADSLETMLEQNHDAIVQQAEQMMILQAVSEKAAIEVTKEDVMSVAGLTEETYNQVLEVYGEPYMYMSTRTSLASSYLLDNACLLYTSLADLCAIFLENNR